MSGKLAQRPNLPKHIIIGSYDDYLKFRSNEKHTILQEINLTHDRILISYEFTDEDDATPGRTALGIACWVTSHARLMLLKKMFEIGLDRIQVTKPNGDIITDYVYNGKVAYCDTDSIYYVSENRLLPHSSRFGEWSDEVLTATGDEDAKIVRAVFVAPKLYMKETEMKHPANPDEKIMHIDIKAKGVTLSRATQDVVTGERFYEKAKEYLKNDAIDLVPIAAPQLDFQIIPEHRNADGKRYVKTVVVNKQINVTHGKRMVRTAAGPKFGWTEELGHCGDDE